MITLAEVPKVKSGVYCLKLLGEVIYVGCSRNIIQRVGAHNVKGFDSVDIHWCSEDVMRHQERAMISSLKPRLNGSKKDKSSAGFRGGLLRSLQLRRKMDAQLLSRFGKLVLKMRDVRRNQMIKPTDVLREILIEKLNAEEV